MKLIRILSLLLLLTWCLSGCSNIHQSAIARSPAVHTVSEADMPRSVTEDEYAELDSDLFAKELPIPLHLIPRELFQTATDEWIEYIPTISCGVCYLYAYDAGEEIITYVVMLDIISSSYIGSHTGTIEADEKEISLYGTKQDLQIGIASNCAIKWNKTTDSLTVWADPPFRPEVKATLQAEKEEYEGNNVGIALTEWSLGGRVAKPLNAIDTPIIITNVITEITNWLFADEEVKVISDLSYGIIEDAENRGEISYWSHYNKQDHTNNEQALITARAHFQSNYLYQSYNYGGTALGGVRITHAGRLTNESDYILLTTRFTGTDPEIAQQIKWTINVTLTFAK